MSSTMSAHAPIGEVMLLLEKLLVFVRFKPLLLACASQGSYAFRSERHDRLDGCVDRRDFEANLKREFQGLPNFS